MAKQTICIISENSEGLFENILNENDQPELVHVEFDIDFKQIIIEDVTECDVNLEDGEGNPYVITVTKLPLKKGKDVYISGSIQDNVDVLEQSVQDLIEELSARNSELASFRELRKRISEVESNDDSHDEATECLINEAA